MGEATFHTAEDGYPARDAPAWSEEKLMILECYIQAFARACAKAGGWFGLDLFAGTGLNYSLLRSVEIPGSPLILVDAEPPPATKVLLCETRQTGPPVLQVPSHLRTLDTRIEEVELALRELIRNRLNGEKERLSSHVMQKVRERIDNASRKQPGLAQRASQDLATELQYLDLRDLEVTITAKALWPEFAELFGTKEALSMRFGQLAELRNAIRHSREVTTIMRNDGEAALGWFREALAATQVTTTTDSVGSPKP